MEFHASIHEEDGSYWAEVDELPGCFASGQDFNELKDAIIEAISMYLAPADPGDFGKKAHEPMWVGSMTVATGPLVAAGR